MDDLLQDGRKASSGARAWATAASSILMRPARSRSRRFAQVELGIDPQAAKNKALADAAISKFTLAVAVERYLDFKKPVLRAVEPCGGGALFRGPLGRPMLTQPLETIRRLDVASRLQEVAKAHGRVSASRARANLSSLLSWAMREGLIDSNVVIGTNNPAPPSSRDRVLSAPELAAAWNTCGGDDDHGRIVRILDSDRATPQRSSRSMMWDELDLDGAMWRIPGDRTKNHRDHDVPLSPQVLEYFERARPLRATPCVRTRRHQRLRRVE